MSTHYTQYHHPPPPQPSQQQQQYYTHQPQPQPYPQTHHSNAHPHAHAQPYPQPHSDIYAPYPSPPNDISSIPAYYPFDYELDLGPDILPPDTKQQQQQQDDDDDNDIDNVKPENENGENGERPETPEITFNVSEHYVVETLVGEGAYGHVASAIHVHSGTRVAIKRIAPFDHSMFAQRTLREIKLLRHFRHENIISILDIIAPPSYEHFNEVYLVQELMETDLHRVIHSQVLSDDHCQYFLYQTVRGLKALHSANVLHRDLKPSNLLLNANCDLKICDFGLARSAAAPPPDAGPNGGNGFMTEYVATRWYRAPEVMLSFQEYTKAIDMWSIGCILAEMINGKPLFPGRDYHHQLHLILDVVGTPTMDDFNEITSAGSKDYLRTLPFTRRRRFEDICPNGQPKAIDFMKKCLTFSPSKRMTVEQALNHVYLEPYHDESDEPGAEPLKPEFFNFTLPVRKDGKDNPKMKEMLKRMIYAEILKPVYG